MVGLLLILALPLRAAQPAPQKACLKWNGAKDPVSQLTADLPSSLASTPDNFHLVSRAAKIYRSARPGRQGLRELQRFGIKTILNLQERFESPFEDEEARRLGIREVNVRMNGFRTPSFKQLDRALAFMTDPSLPHPLLVHCWQGEDRTGVVVAAYRVIVERVPAREAAQEALSIGCCHVMLPARDLEKFLLSYQAYRSSRSAP